MPLLRRIYKCQRVDLASGRIPRACFESLRIPRNIIVRNSRRRTICMSRPECSSNSSSSLSSCQEDSEDENCTRDTCKNRVKRSCNCNKQCTLRRRTTISSLNLNRVSSCKSISSCKSDRCECPIGFQTQANSQPCDTCKRIIENVSKSCQTCKNNSNSQEDCSFCKKVKEHVLRDCNVCRFTCFPPPPCLFTTCSGPPSPSCAPPSSRYPPRCVSIDCSGPSSPPCPPRRSCIPSNCTSVPICHPRPSSCPRSCITSCPLACPPPQPVIINSACSPLDCPHAIPLSVSCHFCKKKSEKAQTSSKKEDSDDESDEVVKCPHALLVSDCQICCKKPELPNIRCDLDCPPPLPIKCKIKNCKHAEATDECRICCDKVDDCEKSQQTSEFLPYPVFSEVKKGCGSTDCPTTCTCEIPPAFRQLTPGCTSNISGSCNCRK